MRLLTGEKFFGRLPFVPVGIRSVKHKRPAKKRPKSDFLRYFWKYGPIDTQLMWIFRIKIVSIGLRSVQKVTLVVFKANLNRLGVI